MGAQGTSDFFFKGLWVLQPTLYQYIFEPHIRDRWRAHRWTGMLLNMPQKSIPSSNYVPNDDYFVLQVSSQNTTAAMSQTKPGQMTALGRQKTAWDRQKIDWGRQKTASNRQKTVWGRQKIARAR